MSFIKKDVDFFSKKTKCSAMLCLPDGVKRPPVVVMAHGFGAEKDFGILPYAEKFVERGLAVFLFDYRNFGESSGTPRNLVNPFRHVEDWRAAIAHVRTLGDVDGNRIALWGTSFSGGHVIVTAARDKKIRAVVSQVPFVDGRATAMFLGMKFVLLATIKGLRDILRMVMFRDPYYVPVVAEPDEFACMNTPGSMSGYLRLVPKDSSWRNECPARALLLTTMYRPIRSAPRLRCPALFVMAEYDSLIPAKCVKKAAEKVPNSELISLPCGHFDPYIGKLFDEVSKAEADFLERELKS